MDLGLRGKTALITGGNTGIGLAIAHGLAAEGVDLLLTGRRGKELDAAVRELADRHTATVSAAPADLTALEDIGRLIRRVQDKFGGVDILINNAGQGTNETILDAPDSRWQYYWDLHVMSAVRLARALAPLMRQRGGGVILHNASICATQPLGHEPVYNVTKAALVMFSKCLANELSGANIRVNAVNPGLVATAPWKEWAEKATEGTSETWEDYLNRTACEKVPIGRFATPEEIADFFVFLCSRRAAYCLGSTYYIDGGWLGVVT
jgi:NAD(P)-dependent dehydrogenase (short-subunit alcohol dehydrogenase family)